MSNEPQPLAETDRYLAWRDEDEGAPSYHVDLGNLTLHFDDDEWQELLALMRGLV